MSKKIVTRTPMTDKAHAITALKAGGLAFEEVGSTVLRIKSGTLMNANLDLTTGTVTGDSDTGYRQGELGGLLRDYTEAKHRALAARDGVQIKDRIKQKDGSVILKCVAFG